MTAGPSLSRLVPLVVVDGVRAAAHELEQTAPACSCPVVLAALSGWPVHTVVASVAHADLDVLEPRVVLVRAGGHRG